MKKLVFLTGTRADYGKMKPLMHACENMPDIGVHIYVSGMHLLERYGCTYREVLGDNYSNVRLQETAADSPYMDVNLAALVADFSAYVREINPNMIVVHGDRIDALAGAIVAMLNGVCLGHIEGGEITGAVDESIRHAISKMANLHFVANNESYFRLRQLGENADDIYIIGSPDIDVMLSGDLPAPNHVKETLGIPFSEYSILIYHPVTNETDRLCGDICTVMDAVVASGKNYVIIYPNNDTGTEIVLQKYREFQGDDRFRFFPSIRFELFLTLLKNAQFIIGNSSCGIREACVYGVPAIDIGTRQKERYVPELLPNIRHVEADKQEILKAIQEIEDYRVSSSYFGDGSSAKKFVEILRRGDIWKTNTQKRFLDTPDTKRAIAMYHNEVCF